MMKRGATARFAVLALFAVLGTAILLAASPVSASLPFNPVFAISGHTTKKLNTPAGITLKMTVPAGNQYMDTIDYELPPLPNSITPAWKLASGSSIPYGDVVATATMSTDTACDGLPDSYSWTLVNDPVDDPGNIAEWVPNTLDGWQLQFTADILEDGTTEINVFLANYSMPYPNPYPNGMCAPQTFTLNINAKSSPHLNTVLTNPATAGTYLWDGIATAADLNIVAGNTVAVCVGDQCDTDGDHWGDNWEQYITTDPLDACPDNTADNAWPPDVNNNKTVNVSDVLLFKPHLLTSVGNTKYSVRFDMNANGTINVADVLLLKPYLLKSCTN